MANKLFGYEVGNATGEANLSVFGILLANDINEARRIVTEEKLQNPREYILGVWELQVGDHPGDICRWDETEGRYNGAMPTGIWLDAI